MYLDKDLQEQWKIKQVNVPDSGTRVILLFSFFLNINLVSLTCVHNA